MPKHNYIITITAKINPFPEFLLKADKVKSSGVRQSKITWHKTE